MDQTEDDRECGPGARAQLHRDQPPSAVSGRNLPDTLVRTADTSAAAMTAPKGQLLAHIVKNASERATIRVLDAARCRLHSVRAGMVAGSEQYDAFGASTRAPIVSWPDPSVRTTELTAQRVQTVDQIYYCS